MMKLIAVRRVQMAQTGKTDVPLPPAPPPHPGYAPNAALHAIKRHAQEFATPKAQAVKHYDLYNNLTQFYFSPCSKISISLLKRASLYGIVSPAVFRPWTNFLRL